jgi:two-component system response regulator RegX3
MATNVLLVDDDTHYWEVTAYVLRRAGFDISVVPTAKEAEEPCKQGRVDLVLLNAQLKDIAALELCRVLAKTSGVPVLVLSTSPDESDILAHLPLERTTTSSGHSAHDCSLRVLRPSTNERLCALCSAHRGS